MTESVRSKSEPDQTTAYLMGTHLHIKFAEELFLIANLIDYAKGPSVNTTGEGVPFQSTFAPVPALL